MPFNVTTIKDKASRAKESTSNKFKDTRDKYSSTPMSKTKFAEGGYVPDARSAPPLPPPSRSSVSSNSRASLEAYQSHPPAPLVTFSTKPSAQVGRQAPQTGVRSPPPPRRVVTSEPKIEEIDWANLSQEDKQEFFAWLDEFFARFLNTKGVRLTNESPLDIVVDHSVEEPVPPVSESTVYSSEAPNAGPPPAIKAWSKPTKEVAAPKSGSLDLEMSYPPKTTYGYQALDLAYYFHPDTTWDENWYAEQNPVPPPIKDSMHRTWVGQYLTIGDTKEVTYAVFFSDLSICWWSVSYSMSDPSEVERHAECLPPPEPLSREQLVEASEEYGETIAAYAESFLGSGQFCARGECWDLANEGIKYLDQYDYIPKPLHSMNRTHGQLIFKGKAMGRNKQVGQWLAADDRVRRGDIIEWKSVKIATVGARFGGYSILGDPDHTAVITKDVVPTCRAVEGESLLPSDLDQIEIVEQSRNNVPTEPKRSTYDMDAFERGEVWIYRPVPYEMIMGFPELSVRPPTARQTEVIC